MIESQQLAMDTAGKLKEICSELKINFIYKSSYDKANRSSGKSFRGFGLDAGLKILAEVKKQIGVPVLTDVHEHRRDRAGRGSGRCAADPGVPVPPDRFHPCGGAHAAAR